MRNLSNQSAEILIYEEIDEFFGVEAKGFMDDLKSLGDIDRITLRINSPGGDVLQGIAIHNALARHPAYVDGYIDGFAVSMASGIAMACDNLTMVENGIFMLHRPQAVAFGDEDEMRRRMEMLSSVKSALVKAYAAKSGLGEDEISKMMDEERWLSAEDCLEFGFVDAVSEPSQMAASFDTSKLKVPSNLSNCFRSLTSEVNMAAQQSTKVEGSVAATIQELRSLHNDDSFVLACVENNMTIEQAKDQLLGRLANRIQDLESRDRENLDTIADLQQRVGIENGCSQQQMDQYTQQQREQLARSQQESPQSPPVQQPPVQQQPVQQPSQQRAQNRGLVPAEMYYQNRAANQQQLQQPAGNGPVQVQGAQVIGNPPVATGPPAGQPSASFGNSPHKFLQREQARLRNEYDKSGIRKNPTEILSEVHDMNPGLFEAIEAMGNEPYRKRNR